MRCRSRSARPDVTGTLRCSPRACGRTAPPGAPGTSSAGARSTSPRPPASRCQRADVRESLPRWHRPPPRGAVIEHAAAGSCLEVRSVGLCCYPLRHRVHLAGNATPDPGGHTGSTTRRGHRCRIPAAEPGDGPAGVADRTAALPVPGRGAPGLYCGRVWRAVGLVDRDPDDRWTPGESRFGLGWGAVRCDSGCRHRHR